jgi:bla regulator protein BlaR1
MTLAHHVFNHLWQSTLFAMAAGLLTLALRTNRARQRYWLWLAASVKFLVPFSLLVGICSHLVWTAARPIALPGLYFVMEEINQPFRQSEIPAVSRTPVATAASNLAGLLPVLLPCLWFCGCAAVLFFWWMRWRRVSTALRAALPFGDGRELEILRRLERIAGIEKRIELVSSKSPLEPGVFGILRPVLWLPAGISDRLSDAQLEAIVAHELCHVRRRDNLAASVHMVVEAIFWFHPLVWWLGARLVEERERACDEEVLRQGSDPEVYAESILKVCKFYLESPLVCVAGVTGSDLKRRIEEIMTCRIADKLDFGRKLLVATMGIVAVAGPIAIGLMQAPQSRAQPQAAVAASFEVASVKPNRYGAAASTFRARNGSLHSTNVSLRDFIRWAYGVKDYQVAGPDWLTSQRYDIVAKAPAAVPDDRLMPMLQALLAERFKLAIHRETKERAVYALVAGKNGSRLHEVEAGREQSSGGRGSLSAQKMSMSQLADTLSQRVDLPVLNTTGIEGVFDIELKWAPDGDNANGPSIFTAVQEQLGLKLEQRKGPMEIIVVDHAERVPTEN